MTQGNPSFLGALRETFRAAFADDEPKKEELFRLAKEHRFAEVEALLRNHPQSWYVKDESGNSLLHWACLGGNSAFVEAALAAGVSCDVKGGPGGGEQTPLMWAVCGSQVPAAHALLQAKADPWARETRSGATALILAVQQDRLEPLPLLVEAGGDQLLGADDRRGCTAAHWAAYSGNLSALTMLESLGGDLSVVDNLGLSPLHHAIRAYRPQVVEFLVERGVDPMKLSHAFKNCIDIAEELRNPEIVRTVLAAMLKRLVAEWPLRPSAQEGRGREAAEANALRKVAARTPLSFGIGVSWAEAWGTSPAALSAAASSESSTAEEVVHLPSLGKSESDIVLACMCFDLDYVDSLEKLRQALAKRAEGERIVLRKELLACFVVTDRHGAHIDLLSQSRDELPASRFPLHARLVGLAEAGSNDLAKLSPSINVGVSHIMRADPERFQKRTLTRVPAAFRWTVWKEMLGLRNMELPSSGAFLDMSMRETEWSPLISNDIGRTFTFFDRKQQQSLQRVLNAYAVMNPSVGYCQGMNMIGGLLLLLSESEEEVFAVFVSLMDRIGLAEFYREGFPLLREYLTACDEMMAELAPEMLEHFTKEGVELNMYLQQWFLTLFIDCLPLPLVLTIWDAIICEGLTLALRVVVTILTSLKDSLLTMRFQEIATSFKTMRKHVDRQGEWKVFDVGHLLVRQAAHVQVPARLRGKQSSSIGGGGSSHAASSAGGRGPLGSDASSPMSNSAEGAGSEHCFM